MSTTHTLHADEDPRDCPVCRPNGKPNPYIYGSTGCVISDCENCKGTGRLGDENAEKVIEIIGGDGPFYSWKCAGREQGVFLSKRQALRAARLALGGRIG